MKLNFEIVAVYSPRTLNLQYVIYIIVLFLFLSWSLFIRGGGHCNHVFALLYLLNHWCMLGIMEIPANHTCTSVPQQRYKPRGSTIEPEPVLKCAFVKASTDKGRKRKLPPVPCKLYNVRGKNLKLSGWKQHDVMEMCNYLSKEEKQSPFSYLLSDQDCSMAIHAAFGNVLLGSTLAHQLSDLKTTNTTFNRPFYSCLIGCLALNESEAGGDLVLIQTSLPFLCKFLLISMRTASLAQEKQEGFYQSKVTSSLTFIQRPGNEAHNRKMVYFCNPNSYVGIPHDQQPQWILVFPNIPISSACSQLFILPTECLSTLSEPILRWININSEQAWDLQMNTVSQAQDPRWFEERKLSLASSNFGKVLHRGVFEKHF